MLKAESTARGMEGEGKGVGGVEHLHQGLMGVAAQGTALINIVLLHQRQQQHAINVPNVQVLYLRRHSLPLMSKPGLTPGIQVGLHSGCNDLRVYGMRPLMMTMMMHGRELWRFAVGIGTAACML